MPNLTVSIPPEVHRKMKLHPEVKWSEVVRRAISSYLEELTEVVNASDLLKIAEGVGINIDEIPTGKAIEYSRKMRDLKWKRISTTRTS